MLGFVSIVQGDDNDAGPIYAVDLDDVCNKHVRWLAAMPRITPHYGERKDNVSAVCYKKPVEDDPRI